MGKKKGIFSALISFAIVAIVMAFAPATQAKAEVIGDWEFKDSSGTIYISKYLGTDKEVTVPTSAEINGTKYSIKKIGDGAFSGNNTIEKVTIPAKIKQIGNVAFKNCTNLKYVRIEGDIDDLNSRSAFYSNSGGSRSYNYSAFCHAGSNSTDFTIEFADGVTRIPGYICAVATEDKRENQCHVTKVVIADSVIEIGPASFACCQDLEVVEGGKGVEVVGGYAFSNCGKVKTLNNFSALKTIGEYAFLSTPALESVAMGEKLTEIQKFAFHKSGIKVLDVPKNVTKIGDAAFAECNRLESVNIQAPSISLGAVAFKNCTMLNSLKIAGNIANGDSRSTSYSNTGGSRYYNYSWFYNAGANAESFTIEFGNGVERIPSYMCATGTESNGGVQCHVTKVIIPDSVTEVGGCAFYNCVELADVTFGKGIKSIEDSAFNLCSSLKSAEIPNTVKTIGKSAFANTKLKEITIGNKIETIGDNAFGNIDDFTIKGYTGSCAEDYANKNKIPFISIGVIAQKFAEYQGYTFCKTKDDDVICYDSNDNLVVNDFKCDGTYTYYFQANGTCMKDRLTYHPDGVHVIYFDKDGHEVFSDFAHVSKSISGDDVDDNCFFDVYGYMYVDVLTFDKEGKNILYANPYGRLECAGWFQFSETVKWADGTPCEGIASEPNNPRYGFGQEDCTLLRDTSTYDWRGIACYMQGNGVAKY